MKDSRRRRRAPVAGGEGTGGVAVELVVGVFGLSTMRDNRPPEADWELARGE
jgi:hypothetical protein